MKIFKITIINLLLLILLFISVEYLSYKKLCHTFGKPAFGFILFKNITNNNNFYEFIKAKYKKPTCENDFTFTDYKKDSPKSLIVTGCSMAYGVNMSAKNMHLNISETISYKLSEALNINVYNRAIPGGGFRELLYLSRSPQFYKSIEIPPEYILYFYQHDHIRRLLMRCTASDHSQPVLFYENSKGNLVEKNFTLFENLYIHDLIIFDFLFSGDLKDNKLVDFATKDLLKLYIKSINSELNKKFPEAKLVIVKFSNNYSMEDEIFSDYKVINIPNLTGIDIMNDDNINKQYLIDNEYHPNELYWNTVLPYIIEELKKFGI